MVMLEVVFWCAVAKQRREELVFRVLYNCRIASQRSSLGMKRSRYGRLLCHTQRLMRHRGYNFALMGTGFLAVFSTALRANDGPS